MPRPRKPRGQTSGKPTWEKAADTFLRNISQPSLWREKQVQAGLRGVKEYEYVVRDFTRHGTVDIEMRPYQLDGILKSKIVGRAKAYALFTKSSLVTANSSKALSNFRALILLSLCKVLEKTNTAPETIDRIAQHVTGSGEDTRIRLRRSAVWINGLISQLVKRGWNIGRATELCFINSLFLRPLNYIRNDDNLLRLLHHFGADEFVKYDFSDCLEPAYSILAIVASIVNTFRTGNTTDWVSMQDICEALGYDTDLVPRSIEQIYQVGAAPGFLASTLSFHVLGPDSFPSQSASTKSLICASPASARTPTTSVVDLDCSRGQQHASGSCFTGISMCRTPETNVLALLYALGGHVPITVVDCAISRQQRWGEDGKVRGASLRDSNIDQKLVDLFLNRTLLGQSIEGLISQSLIGVETSKEGTEFYVYRCEIAPASYTQNGAYWIRQAFELCCHVFPRAGDALFESVGRKLLPIVYHLVDLSAGSGCELPSRSDVVEALVSASKIGTLSGRRRLLTTASKLLKDPTQACLLAEVAYQESVLLRMSGNIPASKQVIRQFLDGPRYAPSVRLRSLLGLLHLSQANNHAYDFNFPLALGEASEWQLSNDLPYEPQADMLWNAICCQGRFLRGEGRFEEAKHCFQGCLATPELRESKRVLVASNLADLYCELEYLQRNPEYLVKAKAMVELELEHVRARGQYLKGFRRLLLSLIEVHINAGWHEAAATLVEELLTIYGTLSDPDITDRLGHVRALIAWARISPLPEAEMRWSAALRQNAAYNPGEDDVFTCGVIHLFISYVRFLLHDVGGSWEAFCRAVAVFSRRRPQFLIPGVGTYLYESIRVGLRSVTGWELPKVVPRF